MKYQKLIEKNKRLFRRAKTYEGWKRAEKQWYDLLETNYPDIKTNLYNLEIFISCWKNNHEPKGVMLNIL